MHCPIWISLCPSVLSLRSPENPTTGHQLLAMTMGSTKPMVITAVDGQGLRDQHKMACAILGGRENLRLNPLFTIYAEPSSPLIHSKEAVEKLLIAAEEGIPVIYVPAPSAGGTAPVTLAGVPAEGLADTLAGLGGGRNNALPTMTARWYVFPSRITPRERRPTTRPCLCRHSSIG